MAKSAEEFAAELLVPVAAIAAVIFIIQKALEWIWRSVAPYAVPILWVVGILFALGGICFVLFMRAGMHRSALKSLVFSLFWLGMFGIIVYCGNSDKQPWALKIVSSMSWVIAHPVISGVIAFVVLILAVIIPIVGFGRVWSAGKREFMLGFESGVGDETPADADSSASIQRKGKED